MRFHDPGGPPKRKTGSVSPNAARPRGDFADRPSQQKYQTKARHSSPSIDDPSSCPLAALVSTLGKAERVSAIASVERQRPDARDSLIFSTIYCLAADVLDDALYNVALLLQPRSHLGAQLLAESIRRSADSLDHPRLRHDRAARARRISQIEKACQVLTDYGQIPPPLAFTSAENLHEEAFFEFETNRHWPLRRHDAEVLEKAA